MTANLQADTATAALAAVTSRADTATTDMEALNRRANVLTVMYDELRGAFDRRTVGVSTSPTSLCGDAQHCD